MTAVKHAHDNYEHITDAYSESSQTSKMELFAKKINGFQPVTIFAKNSTLDARLGSEYASTKQ